MADKDERRNFFFHLVDGIFFMLGLAITSPEIVLAVLIYKLGGSEVAVGCVFALTELGHAVPQLFTAPFLEGLKRKKPIVVLGCFFQRVPWVVIGLLLLIVPVTDDGALVPWVLLLMFMAFLLGGSIAPAWAEFVASTVAPRLRGRLFALRSALGALLGSGAGLFIAYVLKTFEFPHNYAILFFVVFAIWMLSIISLSLIKEREHPVRKHESLIHYFKVHLPAILKSDKDFVLFLLVKISMMISLMALGFYAVYATITFDLPIEVVGYFTACYMAGQIICSYFIGVVADRWGHRYNIIAFGVITIVQCLIALVSTSHYPFYVILFLLGAIRTIQIMTFVTLPMEYAPSTDRPTYMAISYTLTAPFFLSGMVGGVLVRWYGYPAVFSVAILFSLITLFLAAFFFKEPRHHRGVY